MNPDIPVATEKDRVGILDLIDGAIEAAEVSGDAMRWTPQPGDDLAGRRIGGFISDERWNVAVRERWAAVLSGDVTVQRPDGSTLRFRCRVVPSALSRDSNPASTERGTP